MFSSSKIVRLACLACVAAAGLSVSLFEPAKAGAAEIIVRRGPIVVRPIPIVRVGPVVTVTPVIPVAPIVRVTPVYRPWYGFRWVR
jgi:hypothetical protein